MLSPARLTRRQALRLTAVSGLGLAVGTRMISALIREGGLHQVRATRSQLGTLVTITVLHPERSAATAVVEAGFAEIERLERILSRHRPESALAQLNREGSLDRAPNELLHVVESALSFSRGSKGAFDPTVAPVLAQYQAWAGQPPSGAIEAARAKVNYRKVHLSGTSIRLEGRGTRVTLDGIAKGFVVDEVVDAMVHAGADRVLVDAGGDMASGGDGARQVPFEISVQNPGDARESVGSARLTGTAVATSGDYFQRFSSGSSDPHIIDPRTGRPAVFLSSATVVAPTAMAADAISTTVFVLGPDHGLEFLMGQEQAEALLVSKSGGVSKTRGWA